MQRYLIQSEEQMFRKVTDEDIQFLSRAAKPYITAETILSIGFIALILQFIALEKFSLSPSVIPLSVMSLLALICIIRWTYVRYSVKRLNPSPHQLSLYREFRKALRNKRYLLMLMTTNSDVIYRNKLYRKQSVPGGYEVFYTDILEQGNFHDSWNAESKSPL